MKNEKDILDDAIILLRQKQTMQLKALREQFYVTYESLRPINLLKSTLHEATIASPGIANSILGDAIGLTAGYLSRKVLVDTSHNPVLKLLGTVLQLAIANVVSRNSDTIITSGENFLQRVFKSKSETKP